MLILLQSRWGAGYWQNRQAGSESWLMCSTSSRGPASPWPRPWGTSPWPPSLLELPHLRWSLEAPDPGFVSAASSPIGSKAESSASRLKMEFRRLLPLPSPAWRKAGREGEVCLGGLGWSWWCLGGGWGWSRWCLGGVCWSLTLW